MGVSNAEIHVEGPEIPVCDGSAAVLRRRHRRCVWHRSRGRARVLELDAAGLRAFRRPNDRRLSRRRVPRAIRRGLSARRSERSIIAVRSMPAALSQRDRRRAHVRLSARGRSAARARIGARRKFGERTRLRVPTDRCSRCAGPTKSVRHKVLDLIGDLRAARRVAAMRDRRD